MKQYGTYYPTSFLPVYLPVASLFVSVAFFVARAPILMGDASLSVVLFLVVIAIIILGLKVISPLI